MGESYGSAQRLSAIPGLMHRRKPCIVEGLGFKGPATDIHFSENSPQCSPSIIACKSNSSHNLQDKRIWITVDSPKNQTTTRLSFETSVFSRFGSVKSSSTAIAAVNTMMGVRALRRYQAQLKHFAASSNGISALEGGGRCCGAENLMATAEVSTSAWLEQQANPPRAPIRPRSFLRPDMVSPRLDVPRHTPRPPYVGAAEPPALAEEIQVQDEGGVAGMRAAGRLAAQIRDFVGSLVQVGVTTDQIDKAAHEAIVDSGAYPSLLGFGGFPKSVSTSINECICHGVPNSRALKKGDIVNIDVNIYLNGYHAETSETYICGVVDKSVKQFVEVARDCLDTAIAVCGPGVDFREIGAVITDIADGCNYHVVEHIAGHGVGSLFHSAPPIYHYYNYKAGRMAVGQTFTIEPALSMGTEKALQWDDMWTTVTADGSFSAQFKHTVLITESGAEILTPNKDVEEDDFE